MDIEKLEKLNELKEKGILTEEEFNIQKKELLSNNEQSQNVSKKQNEQVHTEGFRLGPESNHHQD